VRPNRRAVSVMLPPIVAGSARACGRGSGKYSDEALSTMAQLVDTLKAMHANPNGRFRVRLSDEELLGHGLWGIGGQIIRCKTYEATLNELGPSDLSMQNTIVFLPNGAVRLSALCLVGKEGEPDTPLEIATKLLPMLKPHLVWRWPVTSGEPTKACRWVEFDTFRNLLSRGRQIRRASGAPGVPQRRPVCTNNSNLFIRARLLRLSS
jgi:hypothetical protein